MLLSEKIMHQAFVATQNKLDIQEIADAEGNACSVLPIGFQCRLHELTQRDGRMLSDSRIWRYSSCVKTDARCLL